MQDVIELTGKAFDLNQGEQDSILSYLIQGGDLSLYGLTNAITRASQDVESYDRATALEGIGWQVATMPAAQWRSTHGNQHEQTCSHRGSYENTIIPMKNCMYDQCCDLSFHERWDLPQSVSVQWEERRTSDWCPGGGRNR